MLCQPAMAIVPETGALGAQICDDSWYKSPESPRPPASDKDETPHTLASDQLAGTKEPIILTKDF